LFTAVLLVSALPLLAAQGQDQGSTAPSEARSQLDAALAAPYQKWLDEDVRWIINDQERVAFRKLPTDDQRDAFVIAFWERRNPTPGAENTFKEEHYRRLAYANTEFASGVPGHRTDRGRIYVMYGPPDLIEANHALSPPSEVWRYTFIKGIGRNVVLSFTDACRCGNYQLTHGDSESGRPRIFDLEIPH
jgi:GWxTD domain-containing protein